MKFAILLLVCCCAVALARPDGSKEVSKPVKGGSKEVKHSGEDSKGSGESKDSSNESGDKSSKESGKKDGGGAVIGLPGISIPLPSLQQVESFLDHVVEIVATIFRLHNVHSVRDLVALIQSNPIGNIIWAVAIHPFLQNIEQYQKFVVSILLEIQTRVLQFFPISQLLAPLELPQAIIQFVFSILSSIAKIFRQF